MSGRIKALVSTLAFALAAQTLSAQAARPQGSAGGAQADSLFAKRDYSAAARAYQAIVAAAPQDGRSWSQLGLSLYNANDFARAAEAFEKAAAAGMRPMISLYNAASSYARAGSGDKALDLLERAVQGGFGSDSLIRADADFASVRSSPRYEKVLATARRRFRPCLEDADAHRFDFWVGEWTVTAGPNGPRAGTSSVQKILGDCVVLENWTDQQGGSGKSLNAYNRALKQWQQFWTDQYGTVTEYRQSHWEGSSLVLTAPVAAPDTSAWQRMIFTPIDANTVRQHGLSSRDGGKTWTAGYDLYYHRKSRD